MKRWQRLKDKRRFQEIFNQGRTWPGKLVVLKGLPNGLDYNRFGFAVGKRLGKAVLRNRIKRRLRECALQIPLRNGWDLIFVARQSVATVEFQVLKCGIRELVSKAHLLGEEA